MRFLRFSFLRRFFLQSPSGFAFFSPFVFKIRAVLLSIPPSCSQSERFSFQGAPNAPQRRITRKLPHERGSQSERFSFQGAPNVVSNASTVRVYQVRALRARRRARISPTLRHTTKLIGKSLIAYQQSRFESQNLALPPALPYGVPCTQYSCTL